MAITEKTDEVEALDFSSRTLQKLKDAFGIIMGVEQVKESIGNLSGEEQPDEPPDEVLEDQANATAMAIKMYIDQRLESYD